MPRRRGLTLGLVCGAAVLVIAALWFAFGRGAAGPGPKPAAPPVLPANAPQPGRYRSVLRITKVTIPGMSPAASAGLARMFAETGQMDEFCLTRADAATGFDAFARRGLRGDCSFGRFTAQAGKIDAVAICAVGAGMTAHYAIAGAYTPTGSSMTLLGDRKEPGMPGAGVHTEAEITSERIGDCP